MKSIVDCGFEQWMIIFPVINSLLLPMTVGPNIIDNYLYFYRSSLYWNLFLYILKFFASIASFYVISILIYRLGKLMKGKASLEEIQLTVIWACVPSILLCFIILIHSLFINLYYGSFNPFVSLFSMYESIELALIIDFLFLIIKTIIAAWGMVIYAYLISYVQEFSLWKAFSNLSVSLSLFFILAIVTIVLLTYVIYGIF